MMCEDATDYYAIYEPYTYTCNNRQYLPANTLGCVSCPSGFTCPGGTFEFNPKVFQGLSFESIPNNTMNNICADNFPVDLHAIYEPNQYTCSPGYYLPANTDVCTICPQKNKCVGGTYTFNETISQGIETCQNGMFAPTGSAVCYPHVLHIGNEVVYMKSTKTTTPSLNIKIGNDIFYANMTTTPTYINKDSTHYFKTIYNNTVYYICDDTAYQNSE